jgi:hypothetical protein
MAVADVDAAAEHVLAWLWNVVSYERLARNVESESDTAAFVQLDVPDRHSICVVASMSFPLIDDRVFAAWFAWKRDAKGDLLLAFAPHKGERNATLSSSSIFA